MRKSVMQAYVARVLHSKGPGARRGDLADSERIARDVDVLMATDNRSFDELREAFIHIRDHLSATVTLRRTDPGEDLLSDLIGTTLTDDPLTDGELTGLAMLLFVTGHETTMTQLTNSVLTLLRQPKRWAQLVATPELVPTAVEELLRYVPLGHAGLPFAASEDLRLGEVDIAAGDLVYVSKLSANRDSRAFPDADMLDLTRHPNRHIAFSHGPHYCLGAGLARMELVEALSGLVARFPGLALGCDPDELTWRQDSIQRGPRTLPLSWT
ncbi:cytochrome P450 [Rhodococcus qingshengii]|uniref:cytochrome P450 n=1 Tax=Rhodococcus qingshengii TaxID=334542 RepID=UPI001C8B0D7E|nr:cytochrome P450 [Rhodococcus qingshengii]MBX9152082.1 cytochrome P450 [Rhodococcus qingshengii]